MNMTYGNSYPEIFVTNGFITAPQKTIAGHIEDAIYAIGQAQKLVDEANSHQLKLIELKKQVTALISSLEK